MTTSLRFREATDDDVPLLADFNRQLIEDEHGGGMSQERAETRLRRWLADGDYRALLFEEKGATVAYVLLTMEEDSAYIRQFLVLPAHRRGGVGRRVVELLLREAIPPTARVTLDVLASNRGAHAFWRSVGFADYAVRMERLPG
ncbi:MAG TPA: GNAT family N-acetyltransferase [Gemmatimonadaceae bacterium]|nr:GNAT family N-acetyltransferase [Gemmatimonadaceae bacterium]